MVTFQGFAEFTNSVCDCCTYLTIFCVAKALVGDSKTTFPRSISRIVWHSPPLQIKTHIASWWLYIHRDKNKGRSALTAQWTVTVLGTRQRGRRCTQICRTELLCCTTEASGLNGYPITCRFRLLASDGLNRGSWRGTAKLYIEVITTQKKHY
jgi:hypothetical protein